MEDKEYSEYSEELERVTLSRLPRREELLAMTAVDMDCFVGEVLLAMTGGRPPPNDGWIALSGKTPRNDSGKTSSQGQLYVTLDFPIKI